MNESVRSVINGILPSTAKNHLRRYFNKQNSVKRHLYAAFIEASRLMSNNYEPLSISGTTYESYREWEQRWELIKAQLEIYEATNVLDIGCAEGWFLRRASEELGIFALGIELSARMEAPEIARLHDEVERLAIMKAKIGTNDLITFPQFDVVLCLSVVHHIIRDEGIKAAEAFMQATAQVAKKAVIFEMGTSDEYEMEWQEQMPKMPEGQIAFVKNFLLASGFKNVREIGSTPSLKREALRYLFVGEPDPYSTRPLGE